MKRSVLFCLLIILAAHPALAMDLHKGFRDTNWGTACTSLFKGPSWVADRVHPTWDPKIQMFNLEYDPEGASKSRFELHYNKDDKVEFEGVPLGRIYYGCDKTTGKFELVVLAHDLLSIPKLVDATKALLGPPTQTTLIQTIWALPDVYVQIDQVYMIIYDRQAGPVK